MDDGVAVGVFEHMGRIFVAAAVDGLRCVGQMGLEVGPRAAVGCRHRDVDQYFAVEVPGFGQRLERIEEDIEPLVAEFVAAAGSHDQRVGRELRA